MQCLICSQAMGIHTIPMYVELAVKFVRYCWMVQDNHSSLDIECKTETSQEFPRKVSKWHYTASVSQLMKGPGRIL